MPPIAQVTSPTGIPINAAQSRADLVTATYNADAADKLARCQELRAEALATPLSNEWDEQDLATYLLHLRATEAALKGQVNP